ncbi:MAG: hypothetical protein ACLGIN_16725 [Candidatus Sericytochromatia bacterium]
MQTGFKITRRLGLSLLLTAAFAAGCAKAPNAPTIAPTQPGHVAAADAATGEIPQSLRKAVRQAEHLMGKPTAFKNDKELDAYLRSMATARPQADYDREGFLASLKLGTLYGPGREDAPTLEAVRQLEGFRPGTMIGDHEVLPQVLAFKIAMAKPAFFLKVIRGTNAAVEALSKRKALWKKPFSSPQKAAPTGETPTAHYPRAMKLLSARFGKDFHSGVPTIDDPDGTRYGTYAIARNLGFSDAQAQRMAVTCFAVDKNTTPYGKTGPSPLDQMDRHFNLDRKGQDTRMVWASRHLQQAIAFARETAYDQAEIELGMGLHSLQDSFAHGQITPSMHGVIGEFPDSVLYSPVSFYEATGATVAYMQAYLQALKGR